MNASPATVLLVPGLRDQVAQHWQTLLESDLLSAGQAVRCVSPMGREDLNCTRKVAAIERVALEISGPIVIVAHSGGCVMVAHWVLHTQRKVRGALLAAPPDFESAMPVGYPTIDALRMGGWLPVPRGTLPFPSMVAASRNDPLGDFARVADLASSWGSELVDLGQVGHLNPASGFGEWPMARQLIARFL